MGKNSAGFVIIKDNKLLLAHPTGSAWNGTYSIPKGHIEKGETVLDAAVRETKEELGIDIPRDIVDTDTLGIIYYKNKKNKTYKKVHYYIIHLDDTDIRIPDVIDKNSLELEEVDWGGFLPYDQAKEKIFGRFVEFLDLLKKEDV